MGRLLHELGVVSDRTLAANQRSSQKIGKGSFAYAWAFDAMDEERERYVVCTLYLWIDDPSSAIT